MVNLIVVWRLFDRKSFANCRRGYSDVADGGPDFGQHQRSSGRVLFWWPWEHQYQYILRLALCVAVSACKPRHSREILFRQPSLCHYRKGQLYWLLDWLMDWSIDRSSHIDFFGTKISYLERPWAPHWSSLCAISHNAAAFGAN